MVHPNETVVRDLFAAHSRGDVERLHQLLAGDVAYHVPGDNPISGDYHGVDAVLSLWARQAGLLGQRFVPLFHDLLASDDHVVVLASGRFEDPVQPLGWRMANVYHVHGARVTECWVGVVDGADPAFRRPRHRRGEATTRAHSSWCAWVIAARTSTTLTGTAAPRSSDCRPSTPRRRAEAPHRGRRPR